MRFDSRTILDTLAFVPGRIRLTAAALAVGATVAASAIAAGSAPDAKSALRCVGPLDAAGIDAILSEGGSPLAGQGATFVSAAASVGIDPRALVAIGAHESVLLTYAPAAAIHNPFGIGPNRVYDDDAASITAAAQLLSGKYLSEGRVTIAQISGKWAPIGVSNDPTNLNANWTTGVSFLYRRLGGNPDQPITLSAQIGSTCGVTATQVQPSPVGPATTPSPSADTNPLVAAGRPAPTAIVWTGIVPVATGPGMAGGNDPLTGEAATIPGFIFPILPGDAAVKVADTFAAVAPVGASGCYHVPARCTTDLRATTGLPVVAALSGTLLAASAQEQRDGVAFWIQPAGRDRIGYSGLATYAPQIAHRTAVSAGQILGTAPSSLTVPWQRDGHPINAAPLLAATLEGRP